jgi:hypothetical protein
MILEAVADCDLWIWHAFIWHGEISQLHQHIAAVSGVRETD